MLHYLKEKIFSTRHFENILLLLIDQDYKQQNKKFFSLLTNGKVMRAIITGNEGGKEKSKVDIVRQNYANNQLMNDLIKVGKTLKIHNLVETIKHVKGQYKGFFTKLKQGDTKAKPPKPKKLSKVNEYTVKMDSYKSFSLKKHNEIGLNLSDKMRYTHVSHEKIIDIEGNLSNVNSIDINYSNGNVYMLISYEKELNPINENLTFKSSGLDIGINNLVTLYIEDKESPSVIIDGTRYKTYNANFNRFMAKLNSSIHVLSDEGRKKYLSKFRSFLYEKRNNFFFSEFHKLSARILEYLQLQKVTHLVISRNLAELKYNGKVQLRQSVKQSFIQIPFMLLLDQLTDKAPKYNITIEEVNEAYTSKTSSISANINDIQKLALSQEQKLSTNDFKGSRVQRGMFKDKVVNKIINADINGARNICYLSKTFKEKIEIGWHKLCNPIKLKSDNDFCSFLQNSAVR